MADNMIKVRVSHPHNLYKEDHDFDPNGIHLHGFDPVDGQIIRDEEGKVWTPVFEVPRTQGVLMAIREGRLIDVDRDEDVGKIHRAVESSRKRRHEQRQKLQESANIKEPGAQNASSAISPDPHPRAGNDPRTGGVKNPTPPGVHHGPDVSTGHRT